MTDPRPAPPLAVDVVPAHEFDELIARAQKDVARLEREHTIAEAAAIAAERHVSDVPDDPELHDWAEAQLERFVAGLRAEHDAEMDAVLESARDRAATCVERADLEADLVVSYARATIDARGDAPPVGSAPISDPSAPVVWRADAERVAALTFAPASSPSTAPPPPAPVVPPAPAASPAIVAPAVSVEGSASPWAPSASPSASPWSELAADQEISPAESSGVQEQAKDDAPAPVPTNGSGGGGTSTAPDREFWKEPESAAPKRSLLKRLPMFAILQVVGVVIVLVVVLMRIG
jgi:hypothetical protein